MQRWWTLPLLLLVLAVPARAEEPAPSPPPSAAPPPPQPPAPAPKPLTPEQAADAVLAAVTAKDDGVLKALAAKDDPDPWLVADELIRRGEFDAAETFAKAAPRVDVEQLPDYVASRRGRADDPARRARLAAANAALGAGRFVDALGTLGAEESGPIEDVVGVRLAMGRGGALASVARFDASAVAFRAAGEAAARLGWLARASRALYESGMSAVRGSGFAAARNAWERELSIRERRGDGPGAGKVLGNIGTVYQSLGDYAPVAMASATRGGRLAPLPGTREEVTAVADVSLFGKDASEPGLRAALAKRKERWHAVHFACHGLVNPDRPTLSSLALTPAGEEDGFLTALEVLKMEIPSDLVVLSACETGKGKIVGGEGIVGLTRAFMYAGSPRVICSLWKVDDEATRALMTKFYELWNPKDGKPGLPTAEALRQAHAFIRSQEKWQHPYYWAAWVLWGLPD